jgi:putative transposase
MPAGSRFTEAQIIEIIDRYESGVSPYDLCKAHGMSVRTLHRWRAERGRDRDAFRRRLQELQAENQKLRLMLADPSSVAVGR